MKRRTFFKTGAATAVAAAATRVAIQTGLRAAPAPTAGGLARGSDLTTASVASLRKGLETGEWAARDIVDACWKRIQEIDRNGPQINAVIELNPEAQAEAERLDAERAAGRVRSPLHGIPVLLKDNIDTDDRVTTTAGSLALEGTQAGRDAALVRRLREAGMILLGKTNLSEWANFRGRRSTSGWSARGGLTKNPHRLNRNPCGSSSGSGAAVAADLCPLAIGTETNGSIVCPANANGVVGIKPTVGLVSRSGIIPISKTQDTAGPMARSVADAAALLSVMAGVDPEDSATDDPNRPASTDYATALNPHALQGARIGVARNHFGFLGVVDAVMEAAIDQLKALGAIIIDPANIETARQLSGPSYTVMLYEFKDGLNRYLAQRGPDTRIRSLEDLIAFNETHRDRELHYFGQETLIRAQNKGPLTDSEYVKARAQALGRARGAGIDATMDGHRLDAIIAPTGGPAWTTDLILGDHGVGGSSTPAAVAGYPNITVPVGAVHQLPINISFMGRAFSEAQLIGFAYAFEQATQARIRPAFLPE